MRRHGKSNFFASLERDCRVELSASSSILQPVGRLLARENVRLMPQQVGRVTEARDRSRLIDNTRKGGDQPLQQITDTRIIRAFVYVPLLESPESERS